MTSNHDPGDSLGRHYLDDLAVRFAKLRNQAERALAQVEDDRWAERLDPESNSLALIVKHTAGNLRSRWTHFLTTDGEKADRGRDGEFEEAPGDDRASLMAAWERGWRLLEETLASLGPEDLAHTVTIRGEPHTVVEALNRSLAHYGHHVGQIAFLAKHWVTRDGGTWKSLSVPRGRSVVWEQGERLADL